ncbi:hypothetical protein HK099_007525 [Clydaea vesicula]|uniref:G-protein coupled receptors family 3 profile domain-containing protein n=1 Tax=Clydaea vesicula TaxID=447962 RepID=A0AAD5XYF5_9FUNG|nr:hypothetical protein HK099_007525 [Clydaea vesicula]
MKPITITTLTLLTILQQIKTQLGQDNQKSLVNNITFALALPYSVAGDLPDYLMYKSVFPSISTTFVVREYLKSVNANYSILPNLTVLLSPVDTYNSGYGAMYASSQIQNQLNAFAVIGEIYPENTQNLAPAFGFLNILQCIPSTASMSLSNKNDFPTTFQTASTAAQIANAMIDLLVSLKFNMTSLLMTDSNYGSAFGDLLSKRAAVRGIKVKMVQSFRSKSKDYTEELKLLNSTKAKVFLIQAEMFDFQNIMISAKKLGMMTADYAYVVDNGYDHDIVVATNNRFELTSELPNLAGIFQVQSSIPDTEEANYYKKVWKDLFPFNSSFSSDKNCSSFANSKNISVGDQYAIPETVSGCFPKTDIWAGRMSSMYLRLNNRVPELKSYVFDALQCVKSLVEIFDHNLKNNIIDFEDIKNTYKSKTSGRSLQQLYGNDVTELINSANIDGWEEKMIVDNNGDVSKDQFIYNYQFNPELNISMPVHVGTWKHKKNDSNIEFFAKYSFIDNSPTPPREPLILVEMVPLFFYVRYGFAASVVCCSIFTVFLGVYMLMKREVKVFQAASPVFLFLIVVGANISYIGAYVQINELSAFTCVAAQWFKYLGFAMVFGSLLIKTYRIEIIFNSKSKKISIRDALLTIYTIITSIRPYVSHNLKPGNVIDNEIVSVFQTDLCEYQWFNYVLLGIVLLTLLYGCFLIFSVRNTPSAFNESKWIAFSIYNWTFVGIIVQIIIITAITNPDMIYAAEAVMVILTQTGVVALLFIPKIIKIKKGEGDILSTGFKTNSNMESGSPTTSPPLSTMGKSNMFRNPSRPQVGNSREGINSNANLINMDLTTTNLNKSNGIITAGVKISDTRRASDWTSE